jgi:carboxyl-terminal processing protease
VCSLCFLADSFVSSPPVGVGIVFAIDADQTAVVHDILPGTPAAGTAIRKGDQLLKIDEVQLYRADYLDMVDAYLGRVGTSVVLQFKRPDHPHPVTATLRRSAGSKSEIECDLPNDKVVERVRFLEKSLLNLRFELEEWGLKSPVERIHELTRHR